MLDQLTSIDALPATTRVWIYQSSRPFTEAETEQVREHIQRFVSQWVSHNRALRAAAEVLHHRFVLLMVDESQADASGCSIDASVHFLKGLQAEFGVDLFDRMRFSYEDANGQVHTLNRDDFAKAYAAGTIRDETIVFDTLVDQKGAFDEQFRKPLKDSWHARMV